VKIRARQSGPGQKRKASVIIFRPSGRRVAKVGTFAPTDPAIAAAVGAPHAAALQKILGRFSSEG